MDKSCFGPGDIVTDLFGPGGTDIHTASAEDTEIMVHRGAGFLNPDGLDRTVADAFIAIPALGLFRVDGGDHEASGFRASRW